MSKYDQPVPLQYPLLAAVVNYLLPEELTTPAPPPPPAPTVPTTAATTSTPVLVEKRANRDTAESVDAGNVPSSGAYANGPVNYMDLEANVQCYDIQPNLSAHINVHKTDTLVGEAGRERVAGPVIVLSNVSSDSSIALSSEDSSTSDKEIHAVTHYARKEYTSDDDAEDSMYDSISSESILQEKPLKPVITHTHNSKPDEEIIKNKVYDEVESDASFSNSDSDVSIESSDLSIDYSR